MISHCFLSDKKEESVRLAANIVSLTENTSEPKPFVSLEPKAMSDVSLTLGAADLQSLLLTFAHLFVFRHLLLQLNFEQITGPIYSH